jgi:hypothetical protein
MLRLEEREVAAAAERRTRAGEYHAARFGVAIQVVPDIEQLAVQGLVDDVVRLRAIDGHYPNGAVRRYQKFVAQGVGFLDRFFRYVSINSELTVAISLSPRGSAR